MGRIKTTLIKRSGNAVIKQYKDSFGTDYDANKIAVSRLVDVKSKKLRNIIAGHVTREMKKKQDQ